LRRLIPRGHHAADRRAQRGGSSSRLLQAHEFAGLRAIGTHKIRALPVAADETLIAQRSYVAS
jgi:hypothetical protein